MYYNKVPNPKCNIQGGQKLKGTSFKIKERHGLSYHNFWYISLVYNLLLNG
jgi:hypothetical protein